MTSVDKSLVSDKCRNCGNVNIGSYCPECGQKTYNERFTLKAFFRVFLNAFDLERGFFHTLIMLFKSPGKIINDYLNGNTKRYFNPLKYMLILAGINAVLAVWLNVFDAQQETAVELLGQGQKSNIINSKLSQFIKDYLNLLELIMLPLFSLIAKWIYGKKKLFYGEHLIIMCFLFAQTSVIAIAFQPFYLFFPGLYGYSFILSLIIIISYLAYGLYKVHRRSIFNSVIASLAIYITGMVIILLISVMLFIVITLILKASGIPVEYLFG